VDALYLFGFITVYLAFQLLILPRLGIRT